MELAGNDAETGLPITGMIQCNFCAIFVRKSLTVILSPSFIYLARMVQTRLIR